MIDLEQRIRIKWDKKSKKYYESLGYIFTSYSEYFDVMLKDLKSNSNEKVVVYCDGCKKKLITPYRNYNRILEKSGVYRCRKCNAPYTSEIRINNNKKRQIKNFQTLVSKIGAKSVAKESDYNGYSDPMPFVCPKHGIQKLSIKQLGQGIICKECGKEIKGGYRKVSTEELIEMVRNKNKNDILNPEEYVNFKTKNLKIICGSCGNIFTTSLSSLEGSKGHCSDCGAKINGDCNRLSIDKVIDCSTINGICYLTNPEDYVNANTKNLVFRCIECNEKFTRDLSHYKNSSKRCKKCIAKLSEGEYKILQYLENNNIEYITQKRYDDCRDRNALPFDFFLPEYNCCIEFDGYQHYKMAKFDTVDSFNLRKAHDSIKTDFCAKNNIVLIRIPYYEYKNIDLILNNKISKLIKCS